jgi:hypothetical protein
MSAAPKKAPTSVEPSSTNHAFPSCHIPFERRGVAPPVVVAGSVGASLKGDRSADARACEPRVRPPLAFSKWYPASWIECAERRFNLWWNWVAGPEHRR